MDLLIVGPEVALIIILSGPARVLLDGDIFYISITIGHHLRSISDIQIIQIFFAYPVEYLIPPTNYNVTFGNGNFEEFGK